MEERMKKYRLVSPERAKVWTEKSPKYNYNNHYGHQQPHHNRIVPVVYYLCRNRQLEHPHFMEVSLSFPDGLYLRDVIERLNILRGRGMASIYSWSCKRSYKNGYVWHDLCENDLVLPAHGNEYVLKGSELFEESNSGHFSTAGNVMLHDVKVIREPPSSRSQEESSSSSSLNGRTTKSSPDDELSPPSQRPCSAAMTRDSAHGKNYAWNGSLSLMEYKAYKDDCLVNASTQTEQSVGRSVIAKDTCTRGVSTDDESFEPEGSDHFKNQVPRVKETSDICQVSPPPPSTSGASTTSVRTDTLESLIRADAMKFNSFRIIEEDELRRPSSAKLKASNMLMQLISCGSISVKDHSFGLIPTYRPRFSHSKFPSPLFSTSFILGELDFCDKNRSPITMSLEDKKYFSGSFMRKNMLNEEAPAPMLKRSSSFNADRSTEQFDSVEESEESSSKHPNCVPRSIKASIGRQPRSESMRSPLSEVPRISSDRAKGSRTMTSGLPDGVSKRSIEKENTIIEES